MGRKVAIISYWKNILQFKYLASNGHQQSYYTTSEDGSCELSSNVVNTTQIIVLFSKRHLLHSSKSRVIFKEIPDDFSKVHRVAKHFVDWYLLLIPMGMFACSNTLKKLQITKIVTKLVCTLRYTSINQDPILSIKLLLKLTLRSS